MENTSIQKSEQLAQEVDKKNDLMDAFLEMEELPDDLHLLRESSDEDYDFVQKIIHSTDLSYYEIQKDQFYLVKNTEWEIISFCRMFRIWPNQFELGSLRVNPAYRWKKLGYGIMHSLLTEKNLKAEVFGACKKELSGYYKKVWFHEIDTWDGVPEKLIWTKEWAEEQWYNFCLMKYKKE